MIYIGRAVHSIDANECEYLSLGGIKVNDETKMIEKVEEINDLHGYLHENSGENIFKIEDDEFFSPGFVDTHTHAPQFPNIGYGFKFQLMDWLNSVTFPTESKYEDVEVALKDYKRVVEATISAGTTTCSYYGSLHLDATKVLAKVCHDLGQRALVGKVNMDRNSIESYKDKSIDESFNQTVEFVNYVNNLNSSLVLPVITPRFAICCSDDLLKKLGKYVNENDLHIQTHLSENTDEIDFTLSLFPNLEDETYTDIYNNRGLINDKTILAHCCHLSENELKIIKDKNAGVSHCPTSNFNLRSGIAQIAYMLEKGIKVGLGSDCSGGYELGILNVLRNASLASKTLEIINQNKSSTYLSLENLFYLATLGGAKVCNLDKVVGNFKVGKKFDALVIKPYNEINKSLFESSSSLCKKDSKEKLKTDWERWLFGGERSNIKNVIIDNKIII